MRFLILFSIIFGLFSNSLFARWATRDDMEIEYEEYKHILNIDEDGSYRIEKTQKINLLREGAREIFAHYVMYYNANEELDIIDAYTIVNGEKYSVDKNLIERKPLASEAHGFDQRYQVSIPFPRAEVGASVYLKSTFSSRTAPVKGHYSFLISFGSNRWWKDLDVEIYSKKPLYIKENNPNKFLKIDKKNQKFIKIKLAKPFAESIVNDVVAGALNSKYSTWVSISTYNSWNEVSKLLSEKYNAVAKQKLPVEFQEIAKLALNEKSDTAKINLVTSELQNYIQYLGDWKTVEGRFFPRDLDVVSNTHYGDCKDFATSTVAILNKIGLDASIALVERGEIINEYNDPLPGLANFNHAIVYVKSKTGKEYWIDPTNITSNADGIFDDIANRYALVLNSKIKNPYRFIGMSNYKTTKNIHDETISILGEEEMRKRVKVSLTNEAANYVAARGLYNSKQALEDRFYQLIEPMYIYQEDKIFNSIPELKSRIVEDINFELEYKIHTPFFKTNLGNAVALKPPSSSLYYFFSGFPPSDSVLDLFIGYPRTYIKKRTFLDINAKDIHKLNFSLRSPWFNLYRNCKQDGTNIIIEDKIERIKPYITYDDRQTSIYKDMIYRMRTTYDSAVLIFDK
ncbi:DUF3857 domain-containing protein [Candidatus Cyrtobacter comes]|nr:DUF3857 domain-containing protein [Candidatus Cyrtobacter comes]